MDGDRTAALRRLFSPRHIAVFGGNAAAEAIRQCRKLGFAGEIWPVHPRKESIEGLPCFADVASLPNAPDASFIAVPREATVEIVGELAKRGAAGAICYASGFAEVGGVGLELQQQLVKNAGAMALVAVALINANEPKKSIRVITKDQQVTRLAHVPVVIHPRRQNGGGMQGKRRCNGSCRVPRLGGNAFEWGGNTVVFFSHGGIR